VEQVHGFRSGVREIADGGHRPFEGVPTIVPGIVCQSMPRDAADSRGRQDAGHGAEALLANRPKTGVERQRRRAGSGRFN
jgi:hypothetical protein